MRKYLLPIVLATGLASTTAFAEVADSGAQAPAQTQAQPQMPNPFDPSTWMAAPGASTGVAPVQFNFAHPAGWAMLIDPSTHHGAHQALMNPATYAQFMQPQFYMQFANPNNWMAWMNPASYAAFMNPATYTYWMNPASYTHAMNPAMYMQGMNPAAYAPFMSPATYMQWMNPSAYASLDAAPKADSDATQ